MTKVRDNQKWFKGARFGMLLPFTALGLADANSYTVPHAAGVSVGRKTP